MLTWYGVDPDPWHLPQRSVSVAPASDHGPGRASARPALSEASSGATRRTRSALHLLTARSIRPPADTLSPLARPPPVESARLAVWAAPHTASRALSTGWQRARGAAQRREGTHRAGPPTRRFGEGPRAP